MSSQQQIEHIKECKKLTTSEAARLVGLSKQAMAKAAKEGRLPRGLCRRLLGRYVWDEDALIAWIEGSDVSKDEVELQDPSGDLATCQQRGRPSVLASVVRA